MKSVVVVTERHGDEAIYVDGKLRQSDITIYACDIAEHAGEEPVVFKHARCEFGSESWDWPETLDDLKPFLEAQA